MLLLYKGHTEMATHPAFLRHHALEQCRNLVPGHTIVLRVEGRAVFLLQEVLYGTGGERRTCWLVTVAAGGILMPRPAMQKAGAATHPRVEQGSTHACIFRRSFRNGGSPVSHHKEEGALIYTSAWLYWRLLLQCREYKTLQDRGVHYPEPRRAGRIPLPAT